MFAVMWLLRNSRQIMCLVNTCGLLLFMQVEDLRSMGRTIRSAFGKPPRTHAWSFLHSGLWLCARLSCPSRVPYPCLLHTSNHEESFSRVNEEHSEHLMDGLHLQFFSITGAGHRWDKVTKVKSIVIDQLPVWSCSVAQAGQCCLWLWEESVRYWLKRLLYEEVVLQLSCCSPDADYMCRFPWALSLLQNSHQGPL